MAREIFPTQLVQLLSGAPAIGRAFTVWTDELSGTDVTSQLLAGDGASPYTATTDSNGLLQRFSGPDGNLGPLFADAGVGGLRQMLISSTSLNRALTTGGANVTWAGIPDKPNVFPPSDHSHPASQISDSTAIGRNVLTAASQQAARAAIGAAVDAAYSTLALGVTATTAAAGNHAHAATAITFTPSGSITATDVQAAIVQAAASSGGSGSGTSDDLEWIYASGAYPTLPTTQPTGLKVVYAEGPVWPSTLPTWITSGAVRLRYKYAA